MWLRSTPHRAVSHCGREQPSLLGVGRSFAGSFFLRQLGESVVGVRGRLASPAARRGARTPPRQSVDRVRRGWRLLSAITGWKLSFHVGGWATGRWRLNPRRGRLTSRWVVTLQVMIMPDFVLDDDRRAKRGGWLNLWRQGGGWRDSEGGGRPRGVGSRAGAAGVMEVDR